MDNVLILIASPRATALDERTVADVRRRWRAGEEQWLAPGEACEMAIALSGPPHALEYDLRKYYTDKPVDVASLPRSSRRKRLLLADMDSTVIAEESIDELGRAAGVGDKIAHITSSAMRGEIDFEGALRKRLAMLRGLEASIVDQLVNAVTFTSGARALVATMRANGAHTALVSGGFTAFTSMPTN
jgi:phosphoserine phosphatase